MTINSNYELPSSNDLDFNNGEPSSDIDNNIAEFELNLSSSEDECHDKECNDNEGHCAHHCSGIHNAALNTITVKISTSVGQASKLLWYYSNKYQTLEIDPALRPPTHS